MLLIEIRMYIDQNSNMCGSIFTMKTLQIGLNPGSSQRILNIPLITNSGCLKLRLKSRLLNIPINIINPILSLSPGPIQNIFPFQLVLLHIQLNLRSS